MKDWENDNISADNGTTDLADEETNLFDIAEKIEKLEYADEGDMSDECEKGEQVDLFEYAGQCENKSADSLVNIEQKESLVQNSQNHPPKKRKHKALIISLISIVLVFAILFTTFAAIFMHYYNKLDYVADEVQSYYTDPEIVSASYVTNILLIGTDERAEEFSDNSRSDSMMIMSVNKRTHVISLVSLERGMSVNYINSDNGYSSDLLTHVFKYGGAGLLINTVQNTLKIKIDGYVRVNFYTFEKIIDQLGGIDIELSEREVYGLTTEKHQGQVINRQLEVGMNHLSGSEALLYARLRWIDSDFRRVERQRKVILAVKDKMKDASIFEIIGITEEILPLIRTNVKSDDMFKLLLDLSLSVSNDAQQMTIPAEGTYTSLGNVDFDANAQILKEFIY